MDNLYQLVAVWYDRLENRHVEHSRKVFRDESMAREYTDRFKTLLGEQFAVHTSRITVRLIELEVME